jgi:hypothetical protein
VPLEEARTGSYFAERRRVNFQCGRCRRRGSTRGRPSWRPTARDGLGEEFAHLVAEVGVGDGNALGGEVALDLAEHVVAALRLDGDLAECLDVVVERCAGQAKFGADPFREHLVAPRLGFEF